MSDFSVSYAGVGESAGQVKSAADEIKGELDALHGQVAKVASSWSGEAQAAYAVLQKDWAGRADDLHRVLHRIAGLMSDATHDYHHIDRTLANRFHGR